MGQQKPYSLTPQDNMTPNNGPACIHADILAPTTQIFCYKFRPNNVFHKQMTSKMLTPHLCKCPHVSHDILTPDLEYSPYQRKTVMSSNWPMKASPLSSLDVHIPIAKIQCCILIVICRQCQCVFQKALF